MIGKLFGHKKKPKQLTYEEIGRMLENIYESGYIDHNKAYKMSFIKGLVGGVGGVIGATVVISLLLWVLSLFHYVPFVNRITDNVQDTVEQRQEP
jgi:hypothetical protein